MPTSTEIGGRKSQIFYRMGEFTAAGGNPAGLAGRCGPCLLQERWPSSNGVRAKSSGTSVTRVSGGHFLRHPRGKYCPPKPRHQLASLLDFGKEHLQTLAPEVFM